MKTKRLSNILFTVLLAVAMAFGISASFSQKTTVYADEPTASLTFGEWKVNYENPFEITNTITLSESAYQLVSSGKEFTVELEAPENDEKAKSFLEKNVVDVAGATEASAVKLVIGVEDIESKSYTGNGNTTTTYFVTVNLDTYRDEVAVNVKATIADTEPIIKTVQVKTGAVYLTLTDADYAQMPSEFVDTIKNQVTAYKLTTIVATPTQPQYTQYIIFGVIFVVIIVFMVLSRRSNKKKQQEAMNMVNKLKIGDRVKTIGGVCGFVSEINEAENTFVLEISAGDTKSYVKFDRGAIYQTAPAKGNAVEEQPKPQAEPFENMSDGSKSKKDSKKKDDSKQV